MTIEAKALAGGITRINLVGRLDIAGTEQIDLQFSGITSNVQGGAIVDLSGVTFLASIGIRTLITSAKTLRLRGISMVLLSPQPLVLEVLRSVGVHEIIPVFDDLEAAINAVKVARQPA